LLHPQLGGHDLCRNVWRQVVEPSRPVRDEVVGFADLGMEAIYEFGVKDMPVTVAVDASGTSVHQTGPKEWQARIGKIPVTVA
jgi:hypothetical protein